jgi:hypothetical protein
MNKKCMLHVISVSAFVIFIVLGLACASEPKYYDPTEIKGLGVIEVNAEYTTYRDVTQTRYVGGTGSIGVSTRSGSLSIPGTTRGVEYYTTTEAVKDDYHLPFIILENGIETFRGNTPIRVTNFDPGVTYTIIWSGVNGARKEGTFVITTARPFTRYIHLE